MILLKILILLFILDHYVATNQYNDAQKQAITENEIRNFFKENKGSNVRLRKFKVFLVIENRKKDDEMQIKFKKINEMERKQEKERETKLVKINAALKKNLNFSFLKDFFSPRYL